MSIGTFGNAPYRATAFHHFKHDGAYILFDVDALRTYDSCLEDRAIMESAETLATLDEIASIVCKKLENVSWEDGAERVEARITELVANGLLLEEGQKPIRAPLAEPTEYATFMINVSQRCNLTCPYCYVNKGHFDYTETPIPKMPIADAAKIVDRIHAHFPGLQIYGYHFYGGEPLLNFKAIHMIVEEAERIAERTGTETDYHITTNGTLLTPEIADFMAAHRFTVYYSIDTDQQTHDELRKYLDGRGSFEDVERNLALLRNRTGIHLICSSVVRESNCLSSAIEKLEDFGAQQCKAERVRLEDSDPLALTDKAFDRYLEDVRELSSHYISHLSESRKPLDYRLTSKILQLLTRKRRDFFCPAGQRMFGIASNGDLYPCSLHVGRPNSQLGNLQGGPDGDAIAAFRHKFSADGQAVCRSCWNRTLCGGGCSAMVDRFGHEKCDSLRAESEAAIIVYHHFAKTNPVQLLALVSPKVVKWTNGELNDPDELAPLEPAAELRQSRIGA